MSVDVKYRTSAVAQGGRDGRSRTTDGSLDVKLATPKELGGNGDGNNPEQLFAAGYAGCFLGALKVVGRQARVQIPDATTVTATVGIGLASTGGFGLTVDLQANLPGLERAEAQRLVEAAHQVCPYSNATRNNVKVNLTVA
jgi:Ohr subfamily peroxiredoxin